MEVELTTSAEATTVTAEPGGMAESEVMHADESIGPDVDLSTKSAVQSDAPVSVGGESTTVDSNCPAAAELDSQPISPPSDDGKAVVESAEPTAAGDVGPCTAAATTTSESSPQQVGVASFDSATGVNAVQSVPEPSAPELLEDDTAAATTTRHEEERKYDEPDTTAQLVVEPSPSSDYQQQESPPPSTTPQQHEQQPEEVPKQDDVPVQDFKAGITCTDVPTAIDVLHTRYRLADVTIHKNMITWSSWNIADIVRGPHRDSFWWRGRRAKRPAVQQQQNQPPESNEYWDEDERLAKQDVEEVSNKIELREREIALMLEKMDRDAADDITMVTVQQQQQAPIAAASQQQSSSAPPPGDKRGNVFQRLLRALRKRFARQQQQQQQPVTTTDEQQRRQEIQRRQRTL